MITWTVRSLYKYNGTGTTTLYYDECGIFEGDLSETDIKPYNGTTALINLGGTYYGGKVDCVTGKIALTYQFYNTLGDNISNSAEQLKEALTKADLILRPIVIYVNPLDEQALIEALGDMQEQVIIKPCEIIERGSALAIHKKSLVVLED